jgi:hypothetical protein
MNLDFGKGKRGPAIYELDGDNLKIALADEVGDPRPTSFESTDKSNVSVLVLKREQAEKK